MRKKELPRHPAHVPSPSIPKIPKTSEQWKAYWEAKGQPWRTKPEINVQRQAELSKYRNIKPDIEKCVYPFSGVKLERADIEWLLATHENGRGPVIWNEEKQRGREGLDLRGADLSGSKEQPVDLSNLPLSCLCGGLSWNEWLNTKEEQHIRSSVILRGTNLDFAHLEGANLRVAQLERVTFIEADLEEANLSLAQLEGANFLKARLKRADLSRSHLENSNFNNANLKETSFFGTHLEGASFHNAHLEDAILREAHLENASLNNIILGDHKRVGPQIADIQWSQTNLFVVEWSIINILGDEHEAQQKRSKDGKRKKKQLRMDEYKRAVRANRQLAVALQTQGLNEDAVRFAYRAQVLQRKALWFRLRQDNIALRTRISVLGSWLFSWFMFLVAGYGYRFGRSLLTYLAVISGFATMYYLYGINDVDAHNRPGPHHLSWYEAFVVSMTAFHGRGFFVGTFSPGDPQSLIAAIEAFIGLLIEVIFIATLTRRLFTQ